MERKLDRRVHGKGEIRHVTNAIEYRLFSSFYYNTTHYNKNDRSYHVTTKHL